MNCTLGTDDSPFSLHHTTLPALPICSPFARCRVGANAIQIPGWFNLFLFLHYGTYLYSMQQPNENIFSNWYFLMAFGERFVSNVTWIANKSLLNTLPRLYFPLVFSFLYLFQSVFSLIESTEKLLSKECSCLLTLSNMFYFCSFKCFGSGPCLWQYSSIPDLCLE